MAKFEKGQSGNAGGRPKSADLRLLCRTYTADAVTELARIAMNAKGEMTRVVAIRELLDRGYGRPMQGIEVSIDDHRPEETIAPPLMPAELAVAIDHLIAKAETKMGISHVDGLTNEERLKRMIESGQHLPPDLYRAIHQASGMTRH